MQLSRIIALPFAVALLPIALPLGLAVRLLIPRPTQEPYIRPPEFGVVYN